ncbi:MAG: hypothetical protein H6807_03550 [Planctomycetes bacterium]|nr:hypothetical protein [Planctomycetota bacterium]
MPAGTGRREMLLVVITIVILIALPVIFLTGLDRQRLEEGPRAEAPSGERPRPGAALPELAEPLGGRPIEDRGPDRVTPKVAREALAALEAILDDFDRSVRRIESARLRGDYHGENGDPAIVLRVFAPVRDDFRQRLESAGRAVGYGADVGIDVELTPLREAFVEAGYLPAEIERAWASKIGLADLEARDRCRQAIESARDWVESR